jgi:hypothetical protein
MAEHTIIRIDGALAIGTFALLSVRATAKIGHADSIDPLKVAVRLL